MSEPVLEAHHLRKLFPIAGGGLFSRHDLFVHAIDDVSFTLGKAEVLAVVGESGCGKSTLALTLLGLERATSGQICFDGQDVTHAGRAQLNQMRRHVQMIFQDPYESLNPTMTIGEIVAEPLDVHRLTQSRADREARVIAALEDAGLKPAANYVNRLPHELSGGQRQRVVIAGALVLEPQVLLADEPVSMLDVSIRAEILNLLAELRQTRGISILFITHDLGTVGYFADRIAIMYLGRIGRNWGHTGRAAKSAAPVRKALLSVVPGAQPAPAPPAHYPTGRNAQSHCHSVRLPLSPALPGGRSALPGARSDVGGCGGWA
ncbi:MAG: dipeptide/oligopeptide/nickel ABC transporter ATP-binding protein [Caldilineaceae bacterium]